MGEDALRDAKAFGTAEDLFQYVSGSMPLPKDRVGTLKPAEYWAVVNYMLIAHRTGVPSGGVTPENAPTVTIQR
jgi:hypothetical protein